MVLRSFFVGGEDTLARVGQGGWEQGLREGALGNWNQLKSDDFVRFVQICSKSVGTCSQMEFVFFRLRGFYVF